MLFSLRSRTGCTARDWERFGDDGGAERFETMMTGASAIDSTQKMVK